MIADAAMPGAAWVSVGAAVVFLLALAALAVDRGRLKRRLAEVERSEAFLGTDLADARREVESLREVLRSGSDTVGSHEGQATRPGGESGAAVG